jgi:hypothetical protein
MRAQLDPLAVAHPRGGSIDGGEPQLPGCGAAEHQHRRDRREERRAKGRQETEDADGDPEGQCVAGAGEAEPDRDRADPHMPGSPADDAEAARVRRSAGRGASPGDVLQSLTTGSRSRRPSHAERRYDRPTSPWARYVTTSSQARVAPRTAGRLEARDTRPGAVRARTGGGRPGSARSGKAPAGWRRPTPACVGAGLHPAGMSADLHEPRRVCASLSAGYGTTVTVGR